MRFGLFLLVVPTVVALAGCNVLAPTGSPSPRSVAPTEPPLLSSTVALRPEFAYGKDDLQETGTAFVVQAKSGDRYLVTASHLYKATEWPTMRTITLRTMEGEIVGQCKGAPLYVGKYTEETSLSKVRERDYSEDLMICLWPGKSTAKPLQLAANLPKKDELVWAVGCDRDNPGAQRLYACRVQTVSDKQFTFAPVAAFNPWDFSGGPVVNQHGEVVGNLLAGRTTLLGTTVQVIRDRFRLLGIDLDG